MLEEIVQKIKEALADNRPSIPIDEVFSRLEERHARILIKSKNVQP